MSMNPYDVFRYNEVQFKASHNSYLYRQGLPAQLRWHLSTPARCGCRGLELDIVQSEDLAGFSVSHGGDYSDEPNHQLSRYLDDLNRWSEAQADHDVVTITIDIKKSRDRHGFPGVFDAYVGRHLDPARIFSPGDLIENDRGLVKSANENGWPTLGEMKGKFILVLSGIWLGDGERTKRRYAETDIANRLCFSDRTIGSSVTTISVNRGNRLFINCNLSRARDFFTNEMTDGDFTMEEANGMFGFLFRSRGFVCRGFGLNKKDNWRIGKRFGVNLLATDALLGPAWAKVGSQPFLRRKFRELDISG